MSAKAIQEEREREDYERHQERIAWLSQDNPTWADGEPVLSSDILMLREQSEGGIALLLRMGYAPNTSSPSETQTNG
jgi:hypothetical protein